MTLDEFFERLPRDGWGLWGCGIRRLSPDGLEEQCPVTAACCSGVFSVGDYLLAAEPAGLPAGLAEEIAAAADRQLSACPPEQKRIRLRLLEHCGLREEA